MAIKITLRSQEYDLPPNQTVRQAVESLGLQPEAYIAVRQGELITEDEVLHDGDIVKLVAVVSGGLH